MILRRMGNKAALAEAIQKYFPVHSIYIEPFFGAGGMFFNKPKARYNIVNDIDGEVYNLYQIVINRKDELREAYKIMPIHSDLLEYYKHNEETEPLKKALRFLFLSNITFMAAGASIKYGTENIKKIFDERLNACFDLIYDVQFYNNCFRNFLKIFDNRETKRNHTFVYCDPPYLETDNNYKFSFTEADAADLFNCLMASGCRFAYSEFSHPFILEQAKARGLNVIIIGERRNLSNRQTEILITNYINRPTLFD